jgi:hypothetical protein
MHYFVLIVIKNVIFDDEVTWGNVLSNKLIADKVELRFNQKSITKSKVITLLTGSLLNWHRGTIEIIYAKCT